MEQANFKVYGYRWIVLLAFMFVVAINQLLWITFAPITDSPAFSLWNEPLLCIKAPQSCDFKSD
jgi:hypothetical protein